MRDSRPQGRPLARSLAPSRAATAPCPAGYPQFWAQNWGGGGGVASAATGAELLLRLLGDTNGLAIDFATDQSIKITDAGTPANNTTSSGTVTAGALAGPGGSLTYTSPSPKLTLQSNGLYAFQAHNLCYYSGDVTNAAWTKNNVTTVGQVVTAGGGTTDKWIGLSGAASGIGSISVAFVITASTQRYFQILGVDAATEYANFDVVSGVVGTAGADTTGAIADLGGGTYRLTAVFGDQIAHSTATRLYCVDSASASFGATTASTASYTFVSCSFAKYPCVTDYIATAASAKYSLPYEYNTSAVCQGVRIEPSATNLLTDSTGTASWTAVASTPSSSGTAPDGTTAVQIADTAANSRHIWYRDITPSNAVYTFSAFLKAGTLRYAQLQMSGTNRYGVIFDLQNGTAGNVDSSGTPSGSSSITDVGNGWYRCTVTMTTGGTAQLYNVIATSNAAVPSYDANGNPTYTGTAQTIYAWARQNELGSVATSPIVTGNSATVTRAADDVSLLDTAFPWSASVGSAYAYVNLFDASAEHALLGTDANGKVLYTPTTNPSVFDGTNTVASGVTIAAGTAFKAGSSWTGVTLRMAANGTAAAGTFDGSMGAASSLFLGQRSSGSTTLNGYLRQVLFLPRAISAAELVTLTT